jgi:hypothetical protein
LLYRFFNLFLRRFFKLFLRRAGCPQPAAIRSIIFTFLLFRFSAFSQGLPMNRMFILTAVMLMISASAFAQGFSALLYYLPENGTPLVTVCGGGTPVPDGRIIKIYHDTNNNGPDAVDPLATLCAVPPDCETGPAGTINYNQFTMNGTIQSLGAGYFFSDAAFTSNGAVPANPFFYLRVYEVDGTTVLWTSTVKTLIAGPQDISFVQADWTCGATGPQCVVIDETE